jgi:enediyne biosynthesis protein E4
MKGSAGRRQSVLKRMLVIVAAAGFVWGCWSWWNGRRDRMVLEAARAQIQAGRYEIAFRQLQGLLVRRPDWDDAAFWLGVCENGRGRLDLAEIAWARVRPGSAPSASATLNRAELLTRRGRQADAEQLIEAALADPRIDGSSLRWFLVPFYWQEGRVDDAERLLEANWEHLNRSADGYLDQSMNLVQAHMRLTRGEEPEPGFRRAALRQAQQSAAEDDRIWLARASLATSEGAFEDAARWLDRCLRRRARDVPVWKAYLRWAMATNRVAEAKKALEHVPAAESSPASIDRVAAWLAARSGDLASERRALERLVANAPDDNAAWDRLGELAAAAGEPAYAAELRRRKTERDIAKARYEECYQRNQPVRDAEEMARLAARLGRWFEARVYLTIAALANPTRGDRRAELARLKQRQVVNAPPGTSLADVLAPELAALGSPGSSRVYQINGRRARPRLQRPDGRLSSARDALEGAP